MPDTGFGPKGWTPERLGNLDGKTYLVTGANAGTGFQAARILLKNNAKVVMLNRSAEKSQAAVAELKRELGDITEVSYIRLDLASLASARALESTSEISKAFCSPVEHCEAATPLSA